jgi:AraC-like DNA-binding protein
MRVHLQSEACLGLEAVVALRAARFVFGAGCTAVDIEADALASRRRRTSSGASARELRDQFELRGTSTEWLPAFHQLVGAHLGYDVPSVGRLAEELGTSIRSLQRALAAEGTSFSRVLERERMARARDAVIDESRPITEVGFTLGYSDPAHFARAFHRWFGMSPRAFRRRATTAPSTG